MLQICGIVDMGMKHTQNDDRILIEGEVHDIGIYQRELQKDETIVAVADGVGGNPHGDIAAQTALETFATAKNIENFRYTIQDLTKQAYKRLQEKVQQEPKNANMATTLTGVYINGEEITTFNLGNSRVYILKNGMLIQLTTDDSIVQNMVEIGIIEESQKKQQENKNIITKYLGTDGTIYEPQIQIQRPKFLQKDIIMLCSDGLTDMLELETIEEELNNKQTTLYEKATNIISKTNQKGGEDNISLILVQKNSSN